MDMNFQVTLFNPLHPATSLVSRSGKSMGLEVKELVSNGSQLCNFGELIKCKLVIVSISQTWKLIGE